jgi:hypothetical protein
MYSIGGIYATFVTIEGTTPARRRQRHIRAFNNS